MIRRPPRSTLSSSSAASDVYKRQVLIQGIFYYCFRLWNNIAPEISRTILRFALFCFDKNTMLPKYRTLLKKYNLVQVVYEVVRKKFVVGQLRFGSLDGPCRTRGMCGLLAVWTDPAKFSPSSLRCRGCDVVSSVRS